jgi:hypothetical protein
MTPHIYEVRPRSDKRGVDLISEPQFVKASVLAVINLINSEAHAVLENMRTICRLRATPFFGRILKKEYVRSAPVFWL